MAMSATNDQNLLIMKTTILFIALLQAERFATQSCPDHCTCKLVGAQSEWLRLKCSDNLQRIKDVDTNAVSVELVQLDLSKNAIYLIEGNAFKNLSNLRRLDLSENKIGYVDEGSFNGLAALERLDLSKNQISTLHVHAFKKLTSLKRLDLSINKISMVSPFLFHGLLALDRLKLNGNDLVSLKEGTLHGLNSLKQLDLSNNPWRCDCELYWFANWIHNSSVKLTPPPKCSSPLNVKGQSIKKIRLSEDFQCQWSSPMIEIRPIENQVVFAGDSITLKCRAPSVLEDKSAKLNWLWFPNVTTDFVELHAYKDPQKSLSNVNVENRYLSDSGIVDSSLSIIPIREEHNGQWNCLLVSVNGNRSKAISVIVISDETRYCPLAVTKNNKGIYTWPRTVVGWKAELPCEGSRLSGLMQIPLRASYRCNVNGHWEDLNTESCPYVSHTTKVLEQFSKVNLSLTKGNLLETAKRFKNYTGDGVKLTDPVEINFITQTIENYLNFLMEEKDLGILLIDVINAVMDLPEGMLREAEVSFKSCTRLIKAVEVVTELNPSIQTHKKNMALEEFRVKRDSFSGLTCTWYSKMSFEDNHSETRALQCTTNNRTAPIRAEDRTIEASIQLPSSLLQYLQNVVAAHQLMVSMYKDGRLFPVLENTTDDMGISTSIVGSKLIGSTVQNLSEPVYVMLKAPLRRYTGKIPRPVVWEKRSDGSSGWTADGCRITNLLDNLIVFHCNRLGYYGLLQDVSYLDQREKSANGAKFRYSNPAIYIGSFVTITCLSVTSVTYIVSYASIGMPKKAKHCVINTWFAMALLSFLYSIGIQQTENVQICQGVGLALHYLSLCCLLWMAVSASNMYKKLSKSDLDEGQEEEEDDGLPDQPIPKPLLGVYLVGWGIALIICGISGAINLREYAGYSHCFLTTGPALAALFVPAGILIAYLIIFHLLIRCTIRNVDTNPQLSEGTQATENMDLELLEPTGNPTIDRSSVHSAQTVFSDIEDAEHSQIKQLKGQIVMLVLYLLSWITAAAAVVRPLGSSYVPFEETIFAALYATFVGSLGIFVFLFYGIARNDVRSQWTKMHCWLRKRKNQCCRSRSVSDTNPAIPTQPLVQNLTAPLSNSQATQVTSDTNSLSSSRNRTVVVVGHRPRTSDSEPASRKVTDVATANVQDVGNLSRNRKMANVNLIVLHRQQYRSNNNAHVTTSYATEPSSACVEMFYNPHQSGVARKFFKKQRRQTKNNNLGPRKQGDGGTTSDVGGSSCISMTRSVTKIETTAIERSILSSCAKVNNTNIHVELNPINGTKNINILSDSGGSISEERNVPIRFVIGQETSLVRGTKKINNEYASCEDTLKVNAVVRFPKGQTSCDQTATLQTVAIVASQDSDGDTKTDEEKHLRNVSQQCSLEYSSEMESVTQMMSEKSDQNLFEVCGDTIHTGAAIEQADVSSTGNLDYRTSDVKDCLTKRFSRSTLRHSNSMYCLPVRCTKLSKEDLHRSSLNDIDVYYGGIDKSKTSPSFPKSLFTNVRTNVATSLLYGSVAEFEKTIRCSERSFPKVNDKSDDCTSPVVLARMAYVNTVYSRYHNNSHPSNSSRMTAKRDICSDRFHELYLSNVNQISGVKETTDLLQKNNSLVDVASLASSCGILRDCDSINGLEDPYENANNSSDSKQRNDSNDEARIDSAMTKSSAIKKETSV